MRRTLSAGTCGGRDRHPRPGAGRCARAQRAVRRAAAARGLPRRRRGRGRALVRLRLPLVGDVEAASPRADAERASAGRSGAQGHRVGRVGMGHRPAHRGRFVERRGRLAVHVGLRVGRARDPVRDRRPHLELARPVHDPPRDGQLGRQPARVPARRHAAYPSAARDLARRRPVRLPRLARARLPPSEHGTRRRWATRSSRSAA